MLILTRKVDEGIVIGDYIKISVVAIEGNKVRLGVTAPINMSIVREELYEAVKDENRTAGKINVKDIDFNIFKPPGEEE